jgi:IS30 family transposase
MEIERVLHTTVYFATPHHAWERGTNENTNGLLRQYLPKGICLKGLTQEQCNVITDRLNNRPRLRLGFRTPNEVYYGIPLLAGLGRSLRQALRLLSSEATQGLPFRAT